MPESWWLLPNKAVPWVVCLAVAVAPCVVVSSSLLLDELTAVLWQDLFLSVGLTQQAPLSNSINSLISLELTLEPVLLFNNAQLVNQQVVVHR